MEKLTKKQVEEACKELQEALIESVMLEKLVDDIKLQQTKTRKRLQMARDVIYHLKLN